MEQELILRLESEAKKRGISVSTLCRLAVNDGKLVRRLQSGGSVTFATFRKIEDWLSANRPEAA